MMHSARRTFCALALALMLLVSSVPVAQADNAYYMYVQTGNSGKLHLRVLPTASSQSLGLYPNGTKVLVSSTVNGWAYVTVTTNGASGFMALSCLVYADPGPAPRPTDPTPVEHTTMYVQTGNSGKLHLRTAPSQNAQSLGLFPNGTAVTVTARVNGWAYVNVYGLTGYMMLNYLALRYVQPTPTPTPAPGPYHRVQKYVQTGNSGKLHLRSAPSQNAQSLGLFPNGTPVYALDLGNGWSEVTVYGLAGYMMTKFLVLYAPGPTPTAAPTPTWQPVSETRYVRTGNSGQLYLRQEANTDSAVLGKYPNGTAVKVLYELRDWCYVSVNGQCGYMMSRFLSAAPYAPTPTPTPAPAPYPTGIGTPAYVKNVNSSFVYLRSSRSSKGTGNVLARVPNGALVTVLEQDAYWSRIIYDNIEGYMVTQYLK